MTESTTYSLKTMMACTGHAPSDGEYLRWFLPECESRLRQAAKGLRDLADGADPLVASTLDDAVAMRAEVRRQTHILKECGTWFSAKPAIARQFTVKLAELGPVVVDAEADFTTVTAWFQ